ncbi:hypothetical protein THAOC_37085 [Thalassiosira oceanica]|uniref:Uncharacterized protein n=1 Tax=Thalassiosira oceanica TaxID=159749 RepID=K0QYS1_THAOC|nr:hypothetical protein THAOC_37085 [Thalassiosira oceanica]|eukprot:EJK44378.1 hypothetical protein THAOC_37085 [Thalassiosira oceanica]
MDLAAFSPELPPEIECARDGVLAAAPLAAEEDEYAQATEGRPREENEKQRQCGRTARVASFRLEHLVSSVPRLAVSGESPGAPADQYLDTPGRESKQKGVAGWMLQQANLRNVPRQTFGSLFRRLFGHWPGGKKMTNVRRKNVALGSLLVAACWGGLKGCDAFRAVGSPPLLRTGVTLLDGTSSGMAFGGKSSITLHSSVSDSNNEVVEKLSEGLRELSECVSITYGYLFKPDDSVTAEDVVMSCDAVDEEQPNSLRQKAHEFGRYHLLVKLLKTDYDAYVKTAEFLSPSRIARLDLPNLQGKVDRGASVLTFHERMIL